LKSFRFLAYENKTYWPFGLLWFTREYVGQ